MTKRKRKYKKTKKRKLKRKKFKKISLRPKKITSSSELIFKVPKQWSNQAYGNTKK